MKERDNPSSAADEDEVERSYRQWVAKKRRRALRNVWRILESNMTAMAKRARQRGRQRRRQRGEAGEPNPVAEFRRQTMPLMTQIAELVGVDPASLGKPAKSKPGRGKRK